MKNLSDRNIELCSAGPGSPSPAPFAKIRLRKKIISLCTWNGPWNGSCSSKSVFRTLGASAPFIAERRQPDWNGRREGYVPLGPYFSGGDAGPGTGF